MPNFEHVIAYDIVSIMQDCSTSILEPKHEPISSIQP